MSKTYPPYRGAAQIKLGKIYPQCDSQGHVKRDPKEIFFVVADGKISSYSVQKSGFLKKKFNFESGGSWALTKDSKVVSAFKTFANGSGNCTIATAEDPMNRFWIYEDLEEFITEVQREIDNAPS